MKMNELIQKYAKVCKGTFKYQLMVSSSLRQASEFLGNPDISLINTAMVDDYTNHLSTTLKPASINRKLTNLHTMLKYAYDREMLVKMPKMSWQKEDNERVRWLSPEEESKLLELLPEQTAAFCEILIHTGLRRGELLGLSKDQVDGDYIRLWKTKTGKARSVPMSSRVKELVKDYVPFSITISGINRDWNKAKQQMGLQHDKDFVLHTLRHTTATRMLERTGNIAIVQRMLGHAKIQTTMRYAHISDQQLLQAVQ
jgi:integrase